MENIVKNGVDLVFVLATLAGVIVNSAYLVKNWNQRKSKLRYYAFAFSAVSLWTTLIGGITIVIIGDSVAPVVRSLMELGGIFGVTSIVMQSIIDY